MSDQNKDITSENSSKEKTEGFATALQHFDFVRETNKQRPLNKRKLLRRTMLTAGMAVLFGLVACVTALVLEPVLANMFHTGEEPELIKLPPEIEEIPPEEMALDDKDLQSETENSLDKVEDIKEKDPLDSYKEVNVRLKNLADEIAVSLVTVTGVISDSNWLEESYESRGQSSGTIVAQTDKELIILSYSHNLTEAETITVTTENGYNADAQIRLTDRVTGLSVLTVDKSQLDAVTLDRVKPVSLGNSNMSTLKGSPIIAMGAPTGIMGSVCFGNITATGIGIRTVDSRYRILTTDIYGSQNATGVIVNMQGQVVGIINQNYNDSDMRNMISALGISELRSTIERMINGKPFAYMGITAADVNAEIQERQAIPKGAYVMSVEMDSPAMMAGIQSGDVIVSLAGNQIESYQNYVETLSNLTPDEIVLMKIMRGGRDEYREIELNIAPIPL